MECPECRNIIPEDNEFCPECAHQINADSVPEKKSYAAVVLMAIGITIGLLAVNVFLSIYTPLSFAGYVIMLGSAIWAAIDSRKRDLKLYKSIFRSPTDVFLGIFVFWFVFFPWYIVIRAKLINKDLPLRDSSTDKVYFRAFAVGVFLLLLLVVGIFVFLKSNNKLSKNIVSKYYMGMAVTSEDLNKQYALFSKAIEKDPNLADAYYFRSAILSLSGYYEKAIADLDEAIRIDPNNSGYYYDRGCIYHDKGDFVNAISDYNKAIELNPNEDYSYLDRASAYYDANEYDKAIEEYSKLLEKNPEYTDLYFSRGNALKMKEEYDDAINDFTKAIDLKPDYYEAYFNRGYSYYEKGEYEKAMMDYNEAEKINSMDPDLYFVMSLLFAIKGDKDTTFYLIGRAVDKGFLSIDALMESEELDFIKDTPEFEGIVNKVKMKREEIENQ